MKMGFNCSCPLAQKILNLSPEKKQQHLSSTQAVQWPKTPKISYFKPKNKQQKRFSKKNDK